MHTSTFKISVLTAGLLLQASAFAASCGDCDGDGNSGILDALFTAQYSLGLEPIPGEHEACNLSGDDQLDIMDVLLLAQNAVGSSSIPASNLECAPVDLAVQLSPTTNGAVPEQASLTGSTTIEYLIASPLFQDTSATFEWAVENGIWYTATPVPNQPVDQRLPTTSADDLRGWQWDSAYDLQGEAISQTTTILVRVQSHTHEDITYVDDNGITVSESISTPAASLILRFRP